MMLSLFVFIYWLYLYPVESVSNLIKAGMIEDPYSIENAQAQFFLVYHKELLFSLIVIPVGLYILVKTYNSLTLASTKPPASDLKEPLLPITAEGTAQRDQICSEEVVTSSNSIQISFSGLCNTSSGNNGVKGDLEVKEGLKAIAVKAAFNKSFVEIKLFRDGKEVNLFGCDIFGIFDGSFN